MLFEGRFDDKVALVTGSGQGMGKATALRFAGEGASVVINDVADDRLEQTRKDIVAATGAKVLAVVADVSDSNQVNAMVDQAVKEFRKIDVLVNNVGVDYGSTGIDADEQDFDRLLAICLKSQILCAKAVVPHMVRAKAGKIVNISSSAGHRGSPGVSHAYGVAKAGVMSFTRKLAIELAESGINVNCVVPGNVATEETKIIFARWGKAAVDAAMANTPFKRPGEPEEIAAATTFLSSDDASYITGACLDVNGGSVMR